MRALTEPGRIAFAVTATNSQKGRQLMKEMKEGKKNVVRRVSRASCVEWSDARESVFMVCDMVEMVYSDCGMICLWSM